MINFRKFGVSMLVILSFAGYILRQRLWPPDQSTELPDNQTPGPMSSVENSNTNANVVTPEPVPTPTTQPSTTSYRDGIYTGSMADAFYGLMQVKVTIKGGRITDVNFLQYPNEHQNSRRINAVAMPMLRSAAISAQSADIQIVSGATESSLAFRQSLSAALTEAQP